MMHDSHPPTPAFFSYYRGRVAMAELLRAAGVGPADEVALQAFTCIAVPEGILALGAVPRFIDIEPGGFNMDPASLAARLTPRMKAVVVQHTFGLPANLAELAEVARRAGLPLIEDCCHTFRSEVDGRRVGQATFGAFSSVEWGKPIPAGIGGVAWSDRPDVVAKLAARRSEFQAPPAARGAKVWLQLIAHRLLYRPSWYWPVRGAFKLMARMGAAESNYNPIDASAVAPDFGWTMVPHVHRRTERMLGELDDVTAHSAQVCRRYREEIVHPAVVHPNVRAGSRAVLVRYPLRVADKPAVLAAARKANVELADWYSTPVHPLRPGEWHACGYHPGLCPEAEQRCREVVTLPTHRRTSRRHVDRAIKFFNEPRQG